MMYLAALKSGARTPEQVRAYLAGEAYQGLAMRYRSDGKGNMAHDALIRDTGMGEKQQMEQPNAPLTLTEQALVGLIQAITAKVQAETVDADIVEGE